MDLQLAPGRACGPCTACCKHLTIDQETLQKPVGVLCPHCVEGTGCTIYQTRPAACRTWYCGWRFMGFLGDALRPDRCGIMIRVTRDVPSDHAGPVGVIFDVLEECDVLLRREVLETIGGFIAGGVATWLAVPGLPGHVSTRVLLNESMSDAVHQGDGAAAERHLIEAFIHAALQPKELVTMERR